MSMCGIVSQRRPLNPYELRDAIRAIQRENRLNVLTEKYKNGVMTPLEKFELGVMKADDIIKKAPVIMYNA